MTAHVANARAVADFLRGRDEVAWVNYAGFDDDPAGARSSANIFRTAPAASSRSACAADAKRAARSSKALELWSHLANVGDAKSLVIHPASTTHQQLSDDEMRSAGVTPEMVRLSVGLEDPADLIWDLENGLRAAARVARASAAT